VDDTQHQKCSGATTVWVAYLSQYQKCVRSKGGYADHEVRSRIDEAEKDSTHYSYTLMNKSHAHNTHVYTHAHNGLIHNTIVNVK